MSKIITTLATFAASVALAAPAIADDRDDRGEKELADLIDGRVAGEPVRCLNRNERDRLTVITDTALVFRDGDTIYVNRTNAPRFIDEFDVPVFRIFTSSLCRSDQVEFVSRFGGIGGVVVVMDEFIPYTKPSETVQGGQS